MSMKQLVVLALAVVAPVLPAGAQEPGGEVFGEAIDVRVVNVEAVVTDKRGDRVQGLTAADFRLLVDGKEVPIDYFTEVAGGEMASFPTEEGEPAPALAAAPGGKVGTSYLVFIDDSFSIGTHRDQVLDRLVRDLDGLGPADHMAVVAFDGRRIDRLIDWTGDRAALAGVFAAARQRPAWGIHRLADRRSDTLVGLDIDDVRLYAELESAVAAASAAMRGMSQPEGRKVFLLLSGGWPMPEPERLLGDPLRQVPSPYYVPREEELFEVITDTANLLGYTIYPVDVQGIDPRSQPVDAAQPAPVFQAVTASDTGSGSGIAAFTVQQPPTSLSGGFITSDWERGVHAALEFLAGQTGGKPALNSARLSALERVHADTRSYYWLGFTPQRRADGRRHDIRVEVRRPGLEVRSRDGFLDMSRSTEAALETESLLLFGGDAESERLRIRVGEPRRSGLWSMEVPVTIEVPAGAVTALPLNGGYEVRALFSSASLDRWGGRSEVRMTPLRLSLDQAPAPGSYVRYETTLKLRRAGQRLVFAVTDAMGEGQVWGAADVKKM
jgi:VWFA-related protein